MIKRLWFICAAATLVLAVASITYFSVTYWVPPAEKPVSAVWQQLVGQERVDEKVIKPGTIVRIETKYACGDTMTEFQGPATKELRGLSEKQVKDIYSSDAGWEIHVLSGGIVELSRSVEDLCDRHRQYRHLGIHEQMLAIYEGPLGYNEKVLRVEQDMPLNSLPPGFSEKLKQAMDFGSQASPTKLELRKQFEFSSEQLLNTALDSIDEMNDGPAAH